jgi:hypothetical protein
MNWFSLLSKWFGSRKQQKAKGLRFNARSLARPWLEGLEDRTAPAVQLIYNGISGNMLTLTELIPGQSAGVTITDNNTTTLSITLASGNFDPTSSPASGLLSYPMANQAQINISGQNNITTLTANLPGDGLTLGNLANSAGGVGNLNASAATVTVTGAVHTDTANQAAGTGNMALTATTSLAVNSGSSLLAQNGNITLTANQGAGPTAGNFSGITVANAIVETTGAGNLLLQGTGGNDATTGQHVGILIVNAATVQSAGTGSLTLIGHGGQGTDTNYGVDVFGTGTLVTSVVGAISITGTAGTGSSNANEGVTVFNGAHLTSTGSGAGAATIIITGQGGQGTDANFGVDIEDAGTLVTSVAGAISITGTAGTGTGNGNIGVVVFGAATVTSTSGALTLTGTGGSGTAGTVLTSNDGVLLQAVANSFTGVTTSGAITVNGTITDGASNAIEITGGMIVSATGSGSLTLNATQNVLIGDGSADGTQVSTVNGALTISANQGATPASGGFAGITINDALVKATGVGTVLAQGRGGNNIAASNLDGILIENASTVSTTTGNLSLFGTGGQGIGGNFGVNISGAGSTVSSSGGGAIVINGTAGTGTGPNNVAIVLGFGGTAGQINAIGAPITLNGDSMVLDPSGIISATGANAVVTLEPLTSGVNINVGGANAAGVLGLTQAELNIITAAVALQIGGTTTGEIDVTAAITDVGTGWSTLVLSNNGPITEPSPGSLTVTGGVGSGLLVKSTTTTGSVSLTSTSNNVPNLAAQISQAVAFAFTDSVALSVGTVDGVNGITSNGGNVTLTTSTTIGQTAAGVITGAVLTTSSATGTNLGTATNHVTSFNASNSGAGIVNLLDSTATLTVTGISDTTAGGPVTVNNTGGALSLTGAVNAGANAVNLTAFASISQTVSGIVTGGLLTTSSASGTALSTATNAVTIFNASNTTSGNVQLLNTAATLTVTGIMETGGGITVNNTGNLTTSGTVQDNTAGNAISLMATTGALTIGAAVTGTTTDTISLTSTGANNIAVNAPVTTGSGAITANSGAAITETGSFSTTGLLTTSSVTGTMLNGANTVASFNATNTTSGNVQLLNTAATLTVTGITETGGGITVSNTGNLTTSGTVQDNTAGNAIGLMATTGTLTIGAAVTGTTTDTISLTSTGANNIAVNGALSTGSGAITVTSGGAITETGSFSTTGLLTTSSVTGTTLGGANTVGSFNATNTTSGNVQLTTTAATLTVTGIMETGGGITVNNTGNLTTSGIVQDNTAGNAISLMATTGVLTIGAAVTGTTTDTISLTSTGPNNIAVNAAVTTGSGPITVTSGGAITETGSFTTTGLLTAKAVSGVTLNGANAVSSFTASDGSNTGVSLTNTVALTITGISEAGSGAVTVTNAGDIGVIGSISAQMGSVILTGSGAITLNAYITGATATVNGRATSADTIIVNTMSGTPLTLAAMGGGDSYIINFNSAISGFPFVRPSTITVNGAGAGTNAITINSQAGAVNWTVTNATVTNATVPGGLFSLVNYSAVQQLTINGSSGPANSFVVQSTSAATQINTGPGAGNTIKVTAAVGSNLEGMKGVLSVNAQGTGTSLTIGEAGEALPDNVTVTSNSVFSTTAAPLGWRINYMEAAANDYALVTFTGGTGTNFIQVQSTLLGALTQINTGTGANDTVNVTSAVGNNLQGLQGVLSVNAQGPNTSLTVSEGGETLGDNVSVTNNSIFSTGAAPPVPTVNNPLLLATMYQDLLNRAPDPGAAGFAAQLDRGVPASTVAYAIETAAGNEFRLDVAANDYQRFLHRPGSIAEWTGWANLLAAGASQQQVEASIVGSQEYFALHGNTTSGFLNGLYNDGLGRPDSEGAWVDMVNRGTPRQNVALAVFMSPEGSLHQVLADYQHYLGRSGVGDPGAAAFAGQLVQGVSHEVVVAQLLGSAEYAGPRQPALHQQQPWRINYTGTLNLTGVKFVNGAGTNSIAVLSTLPSCNTQLVNNGGKDTINVGSGTPSLSTLAGILGTFGLVGVGGTNLLSVNDPVDQAAQVFTVASTGITSAAGLNIRYSLMSGSTFSTIVLSTGLANNGVVVNGAPQPMVPLYVLSYGGANTVMVNTNASTQYNLLVEAMPGTGAADTLSVTDITMTAAIDPPFNYGSASVIVVIYPPFVNMPPFPAAPTSLEDLISYTGAVAPVYQSPLQFPIPPGVGYSAYP